MVRARENAMQSVHASTDACTRAVYTTRATRSIIDKGRVEKAYADGETAGKEERRERNRERRDTMVGTRRERKRGGMKR